MLRPSIISTWEIGLALRGYRPKHAIVYIIHIVVFMNEVTSDSQNIRSERLLRQRTSQICFMSIYSQVGVD
jgi:hypothetical protein